MARLSRQAMIGAAEVRPRIVEGFVFKSVFGDDPARCQRLIELALGVRISEIKIVQAEREFDVHRTFRAGRVDLYCEDMDGNRYDVEMQASRYGDEVLRARHYHGLMDVEQLRKGQDVAGLRQSVVLFICDFDPIGDGERIYDCRTMCLQTKQLVEDGLRTVLLNAHGTRGEVSAELAAFLRYVAGERVDGDAFVDDIEERVHNLVSDNNWMEYYMTLQESIDREIEVRVRERVEQEVEQAKQEVEQVRQKAEQAREKNLDAAVGLVRDGILTVADAAERFGFPEADITARL